MRMSWITVLGVVALVGCKKEPDYAANDLEQCQAALAADDLGLAVYKCSAAASNPRGYRATVASAKAIVAATEPQLEAWKVRQAARAKAVQEAQAQQIAELRAVVHRVYSGSAYERDADCTGKGLPPYRRRYEGGTYEQDRAVAAADGCQPLFGAYRTVNDTVHCCPR